jgi:AraC family transcriptional regulator
MNSAIEVIENDITNEINFEMLSRIMETSVFNFQRMFSFITNVSVLEYVRRRRLTLAAFELQNSNLKIIDIAIKYGYDSHESFTRAFQKLHGITPSQAKKKGTELKAYPRLVFSLSVKGDVEMNYKIEKKPEFKMFGLEKVIITKNEQNFIDVPKFWKESHENGKLGKLIDDSGLKIDKDYEGLCALNALMCYEDTGENTFPYLIGAIVNENSNINNYKVVKIPEYKWAIFKTDYYTKEDTSNVIQNVWKRIFSEWFPTSVYKHANLPELEMYYMLKDGREYCEIWIPIDKK